MVGTLILSSAPQIVAASSGGPHGAPAWADNSLRFRQPLNITNTANRSIADQPVFLQIGFPRGHVLSAASEVRAFNSSGAEYPSYVVSQHDSGPFVTSAWLLMFVTMAPESTSEFYLYYGNSTSPVPAYRLDTPITGLTAGPLSFGSAAGSPGQDMISVNYHAIFSQTISDKVSFTPSGDYGSTEISSNQFVQDTGWQLAGNVTKELRTLASSVVQAGPLTISRALMLYTNTVLVMNIVQNDTPQSLGGVSLTELLNSSALEALGTVQTGFNTGNGTLYGEVGGTFLGITSNPAPNSFATGGSSSILTQARADSLSNQTLPGSAGAITVKLGSLGPETSTGALVRWGVGHDLKSLAQDLDRYDSGPTVSIGREEFQNAFSPQVNFVWDGSLPLNNFSLNGAGVDLPLSAAYVTASPSSFTLSGSVKYFQPSEDFNSGTGDYLTSSATVGNATVYVSPIYWSEALGKAIGRMVVVAPDNGSAGTAEMLSGQYFLPGNGSLVFGLNYRATLDANSNDASRELFFVAVDVSTGLGNGYQQSLVFPVAGSQTPDNLTAQGIVGKISGKLPQLPQARIEGSLVADGNWNLMSVNMTALGVPDVASFRIRFVMISTGSPSGPFPDQMEMDVNSAYLQGNGRAGALLRVTSGFHGSSVHVGFTNAPPGTQVFGMGNITVDFAGCEVSTPAPSGGAEFSGNAHLPVLTSGLALEAVNATFRLGSVTLNSPFADLSPRVTIGGTGLGSFNATGGGGSTSGGQLELPGGTFSFPYTLDFVPHPVTFTVTDVSNSTLSGANVTLRVGAGKIATSITPQQGQVTFGLLPWNYTTSVEFRNAVVANVTYGVSSSSADTIVASVYSVSLKILDAQGAAMPDAGLVVNQGNRTILVGSADSGGIFTFRAPANQVYQVAVYKGLVAGTNITAGPAYLRQQIQIAVNGAQIVLNTTYSTSTKTPYVATVVLAMVIAIGMVSVMYFRSIRKRKG